MNITFELEHAEAKAIDAFKREVDNLMFNREMLLRAGVDADKILDEQGRESVEKYGALNDFEFADAIVNRKRYIEEELSKKLGELFDE